MFNIQHKWRMVLIGAMVQYFRIRWKINIQFNLASPGWIEHQSFTLCKILYHNCIRHLYTSQAVNTCIGIRTAYLISLHEKEDVVDADGQDQEGNHFDDDEGGRYPSPAQDPYGWRHGHQHDDDSKETQDDLRINLAWKRWKEYIFHHLTHWALDHIKMWSDTIILD